jgi:hypothetical protein
VSSAPFILFHKYSCLFLRIFLTCNVAVLRAVSFFFGIMFITCLCLTCEYLEFIWSHNFAGQTLVFKRNYRKCPVWKCDSHFNLVFVLYINTFTMNKRVYTTEMLKNRVGKNHNFYKRDWNIFRNMTRLQLPYNFKNFIFRIHI